MSHLHSFNVIDISEWYITKVLIMICPFPGHVFYNNIAILPAFLCPFCNLIPGSGQLTFPLHWHFSNNILIVFLLLYYFLCYVKCSCSSAVFILCLTPWWLSWNKMLFYDIYLQFLTYLYYHTMFYTREQVLLTELLAGFKTPQHKHPCIYI